MNTEEIREKYQHNRLYTLYVYYTSSGSEAYFRFKDSIAMMNYTHNIVRDKLVDDSTFVFIEPSEKLH